MPDHDVPDDVVPDHDLSDRFGSRPVVGTRAIDLDVAVDCHPTGWNGALRRLPEAATRHIATALSPDVAWKWKPSRPRVLTVGLTFPAGLDFVPPTAAAETEGTLTPLLAPGADAPEAAPSEQPANHQERPNKKSTRLRAPRDAVCLQDRLFYLLQPPLEQWLSGQELVIPFEPFGYQYEGIAWLFAHESALLADEMGLGKTMQSITAIRLLMRSGQIQRVLLVCPKPLIPNWMREFQTWAAELPVTAIEGDTARRRMIWSMPGAGILLANYELLARDTAEFREGEKPSFDLMVLDEGQRIKNRNSQTALAARSIERRRSWVLTGTPIENRPEELASLYEFLEVIAAGDQPDLRRLRRLAESHILRRTKDLVLKDLPPRLDRDEHLALNPAQEAAYKIAEKEGIIHLDAMGETATVQHVFELVLRLKQISNFDVATGQSSKLDRLCDEMEEITASGGKAILFSQWTKTLDWIRDQVTKRVPGCGPLIYHGGVPTRKREPILTKFKNDPDSHLLLMSYGTGAVGLNLQFAGYVFLFDRWWNPAVEDQAINRAHRIGCAGQVVVTRFICKETVEERIDQVLREKRALFAAILGEGDNTNASLSMNAAEIFGLFDLKAPAKQGQPQPIGPKAA